MPERRYVAGGDVARGDMLPEEICCQRRYVAGGDMLPEEINVKESDGFLTQQVSPLLLNYIKQRMCKSLNN